MIQQASLFDRDWRLPVELICPQFPLATRAVRQACTVVIFGAKGNLTIRKLIPALYNIAADGELPPALTVVGFRP